MPAGADDAPETRWATLEALLEQSRASHVLATSVPAAFSAKTQRKLASTAPPRPIIRLDFEDACNHFAKMYRDVQAALQATYLSSIQGLTPIFVSYLARLPNSFKRPRQHNVKLESHLPN